MYTSFIFTNVSVFYSTCNHVCKRSDSVSAANNLAQILQNVLAESRHVWNIHEPKLLQPITAFPCLSWQWRHSVRLRAMCPCTAIICSRRQLKNLCNIVGPGRRVPKHYSSFVVVVVVVVISSLKIPKAFSIHSGAQRNFTYTFVFIFPRLQNSLKLDIEPSLTPQRPAAANEVVARWSQSVEHGDEYLCVGGAYRKDIVD